MECLFAVGGVSIQLILCTAPSTQTAPPENSGAPTWEI